MNTASWIFWTLFSAAPMATTTPPPGGEIYDVDVRLLSEIWQKERISPADPRTLKHDELARRLRSLHADKLQGETPPALARWTSEAARRLRVSRRGHIAVGAPADLVIWSLPSGEIPSGIEQIRPRQVILNGTLLAPSKDEARARGKFLPR